MKSPHITVSEPPIATAGPSRSSEQKPSSVSPLTPRVHVDECPLCSKLSFGKFEDDQSQGIRINYLICRYCSLVFMSPRFSAAELDTFYKAEYRLMYCGDTKPTPQNLAEQNARGKHLSLIVREHAESLRSHLDIGCSAGELLLAVRSKYPGVESVGVELSEAHRAWCGEKGLQTYRSIAEMRAYSVERFQLVSLSHVLEHLPNPVSFLKMIHTDVISPDGYLLIEVPNLFGHVSVEVAHLICFSEKTLKETLRMAGYQVLSTKIHSIPRNYEPGRRYITLIATPISTSEGHTEIVKRVWWRWVKLQRLKGLSGRNWTQLALRSPQKVKSFIRRAVKS